MGNALARVLPALVAIGLAYGIYLFFAENPARLAILGVYVAGAVVGFAVCKSMS